MATVPLVLCGLALGILGFPLMRYGTPTAYDGATVFRKLMGWACLLLGIGTVGLSILLVVLAPFVELGLVGAVEALFFSFALSIMILTVVVGIYRFNHPKEKSNDPV